VNRISIRAVIVALLALMFFVLNAALALASDAVICEIEGDTSAFYHGNDTISGSGGGTLQTYKFQRGRIGGDFYYRLCDLDPGQQYSVELSFCEHTFDHANERIFNVDLNGVNVLSNVDLVAAVGKHAAYQRTFSASPIDGIIELRFRGIKENATVSTVRLYNGSGTVAEVDTFRDRHYMSLSTRNSSSSCYETLLSKLGSRFYLNPESQRLGFRQSPLGTYSDDLSDLILAAKLDDGSSIRALPLTDKYQVWENIQQNITMTSIQYVCTSSSLPGIEVTYTFKAPFYPQDTKLSTAPFFYLDIQVRNTSGGSKTGKILFGNPQKKGESLTALEDTDYWGFQYTSGSHFGQDSLRPGGSISSNQAIVLAGGSDPDVDRHYSNNDKSWLWDQSPGYSPTRAAREVYTYFPRGYSGFVWDFSLGGGGSESKTFVISSYVDSSSVLWVRNNGSFSSGKNFGFKYRDYFADVEDVASYATTEKDAIEEKRGYFDGVLDDTSLNTEAKNLIAFGFQSYLANTWLMSDGFVPPGTGDPSTPIGTDHDWFSVWEGTSCQFHSTIDVEYNLAWFYFQFWPDLLKMEMKEWLDYKKSNINGTYLSHDIGQTLSAAGQAYGHDMPVEENTNYILLMHQYWTHTGDAWANQDYVYSNIKTFVTFIKNSDTNGNGLPDINTANTIDQGSDAIQFAKDQIYLGVKVLAAYKAASEMANARGDVAFKNTCDAEIQKINDALNGYAWMDDHFSVCLDYSVNETERSAYSIYPSNGLLCLLSSLDANSIGLSADNLDKIKTDLEKSAEVNVRQYGWVHTSSNNENEWVSQNLWRDMVACYLGFNEFSGKKILDYSKDYYWPLEKYFSQNKSGCFWDVCMYGQGTDYLFSLPKNDSDLGLDPVVNKDSGSKSVYAQTYSTFGQSLGYYPRGATALGLIDASGGIRVDKRDSGNKKLYLRPVEAPTTGNPIHVSVPELANWSVSPPIIPKAIVGIDGNGEPTLTWKNGATEESWTPTGYNVTCSIYSRISNVGFMPPVVSPNGDGKNDSVALSYSLPRQADVIARVYDGSSVVKTLIPGDILAQGGHVSAWDGTKDDGSLADDGDYDLKLQATNVSNPNSVIIPSVNKLARVNRTIPELSKTWYLAEGFTGSNPESGDFDEWVLIQNPGAVTANVTVQFMQQDAGVVTNYYQIAPFSRFTIHVDEILPNAQVSTYVSSDQNIGVERAMYFNGWKAGHDSIGVISPSKTWYLAEGFTGKNSASGDFDEWVLIQNPGGATANVNVEFMQRNGGVVAASYQVAPQSRYTIHVDDILPDSEVSTYVSSDQNIIVERAQYLNNMKGGHSSLGAAAKSKTWYLAEGYTGGSFDEWVLIQNPNSIDANVRVTFMKNNGQTETKSISLTPRSRETIHVDDLLPDAEVSTFIKSDQPVIAERAMYFSNYSDGHCSIGTPTADTQWYFPEGFTGSNSASGQFDEWILIEAPGSLTTNVTVQFMKRNHEVVTLNYEIQGRRRFTIYVNSIVPDSEVSTFISADQPVVAERAMYFNNWQGGTCSVGAR